MGGPHDCSFILFLPFPCLSDPFPLFDFRAFPLWTLNSGHLPANIRRSCSATRRIIIEIS